RGLGDRDDPVRRGLCLAAALLRAGTGVRRAQGLTAVPVDLVPLEGPRCHIHARTHGAGPVVAGDLAAGDGDLAGRGVVVPPDGVAAGRQPVVHDRVPGP